VSKGEQILEMVSFLLLKTTSIGWNNFTIDANNIPKKNILICKLLDTDHYYVGTNDYLANGGDNMNFFKKNSKV
jgi:hypothetical protein